MTSHRSHYSIKVHCKSSNGSLQCEHPQNTPFPLKWKINKISNPNTLHFWETLNIYKLKQAARVAQVFVLAYGTGDWSCDIPTFVTAVRWPSAVHPRAASLRDKGQLLGDILRRSTHKIFQKSNLATNCSRYINAASQCLSYLGYSDNNWNDVEIVEKLHRAFSPGSFHTRCVWGSILGHQVQGLEHVEIKAKGALAHFLLEQSRIQDQRCLWHLPGDADLPL